MAKIDLTELENLISNNGTPEEQVNEPAQVNEEANSDVQQVDEGSNEDNPPASVPSDDLEPSSDEVQEDNETETEQQTQPNRAYERISAKKKLAEEQARSRALELELARLRGETDAYKQKPVEAKQEPVNADPEPEQGTFEHDLWSARQAKLEAEKARQEIQKFKEQLAFEQAEKQWMQIELAAEKNNEHYVKSKQFLVEKARDALKANYPLASEAEINAKIKQDTYELVAKADSMGLDPIAYIMGLAKTQGFDPFTTTPVKKPISTQPQRPQTNTAETRFHKQNAGSVVNSSGTTGKQRVTAEDLASMSIWEAGRLQDGDWKYMEKELRDRTL